MSPGEGEALVGNAHEMILAGACAAVQPKPYYAASKPEKASRFVRGLRMGQTERGSYALTLFAKVSPSLQPRPTLFDDEAAPFARRAVLRLAHAPAALRAATD